MSYIDPAGRYHKESPPLNNVMTSKTSVWKQGDHDRQRADHKWELTQPYLPNGTHNPAFIEAFPDESASEAYNFIKTDEQIAKEQRQ